MSIRCLVVLLLIALPALAQGSFVNFETPQVHPIDISPDGNTLAVCNTPDNRIEIFDLSSGSPLHVESIPVGLDPVTVRFRSNTEVWSVNQISDTLSRISLVSMTVIETIETDDEPADIVFVEENVELSGSVSYFAFYTCSQSNLLVGLPRNGAQSEIRLEINGEDPRAMAVSPDGRYVYAAVFESGNRSTILGGGSAGGGVISFPPNVVDDSNTPHGVQNPPFNDGNAFFPPKNPGNGTAPRVGLIVKQDQNGVWRDDTGEDWTSFVSGQNAGQSGRIQGWTLLDHDVAVLDLATLEISYIDGMMNLCMAIDVNPATGEVTVVGTDAENQIRFEPNVNSIFNRVNIAFADNTAKAVNAIVDLNKDHLGDYSEIRIPQSQRDLSIGEPRGIVWNAAGTRASITGRGSNNVILIDNDGDRAGISETIEVGEGPTGLALDEARGRLYVLNHFEASISVIDTDAEIEIDVVPLFDPTPSAIKVGRKHLYDTHKTSGLGQASCASCHIDSRMDRLSWDLGDPSGGVDSLANRNLGGSLPGSEFLVPFSPFHPMKGPMATQTLQGIIGQEPFHWRGDRLGLEEFNPAFIGLQGDDTILTPAEMQEYEDFLETIHFPPNPFRNKDNTLPTDLEMPGHFTPPPYGPASPPQPLPNGNAQRGLDLYRDQSRLVDQGVAACVTCHTLPSGNGPDSEWNGVFMEPIPPGPMGERHLMLVSIDGSTQTTIKVAQLRNLYDKVGANFMLQESRAGFGFLHDGSVDSVERFIAEEAFTLRNAQEVADLTALMLAFSGSDFNVTNSAGGFREPEGVASRDVHAAVGLQFTTGEGGAVKSADDLVDLVDASDRIELIAKARIGGVQRGWLYTGSNRFLADDATNWTLVQLNGLSANVTFTIVPVGSGARMGIDRDEDGCFDFNEVESGTDPADPDDVPDVCGGGNEGEGEGEEEDTVPPVLILNGEASVVHECGTIYNDTGATATDNVDGNLTPAIIRTGSVNISSPGEYTLTYTVSDSAGNSAQATRSVSVEDNAGPTIILNGAQTIVIDCGEGFSDPGASASDSCDGNSVVAVTGTVDPNTPGTYIVEYDATDSAGNAGTTAIRTVMVTDSVAPVLALNGASTVAIECGDAYNDAGASAVDACEGDLTEAIVVTGADVDTTDTGVHLVTYAIQDSSGNAAPTLTRRVTVRDTVAPMITVQGDNPVSIDCGEVYVDAGATATDACQGLVAVTVDTTAIDTSMPGVYEARFTATDSSGNGAQVTRTVRVEGPACDDTDDDDLPDAWEIENFGSLAFGAFGDEDNDDLDNIGEFNAGTKPRVADSDGDGANDGAEVRAGTDPNDPSSVPAKGGMGCGPVSGISGYRGDISVLLLALLCMVVMKRSTRLKE